MSATYHKSASQLAVGDRVVRTVHHDGTPKRSIVVAKVDHEKRDGRERFAFTTADGDYLGWYSATYQFTVERN